MTLNQTVFLTICSRQTTEHGEPCPKRDKFQE